MSRIPADVREAAIKRLYADAERIDWENLSGAEKTKQYENWLEDEEVGGELLRFKASEAGVRVWMKDGPMKEYSRAVLGVGPNARYVDHPRCTPESVVRAALGKEWSVVPGSIEVKPARCRAGGPEGEKIVIWGKNEDFKYLVFAALELLVSGAEAASIAVLEVAANPTGKAERERMNQIAERCGIGLRFVNPSRPTASAQA
jgi:isocitrate dehydrogenase